MSTSLTDRSPEDLLQAFDRLPPGQARVFLSQAIARTARRFAPHVKDSESDLLEKINRGLPVDEEERFLQLIRLRESARLSEEELEELKALTDSVERLQAERAECLVELAALRGVTLVELMRDLGIEPKPVE